MSPEDIAGAGEFEEYRGPQYARTAAERSLWWALHRPETYALAAIALAFVTLFSIEIEFEIVQAFSLNGNVGPRAVYGASAGIRGGLAVLAIVLAAMSVRSEDEDTTWSAPVARAALIVGVIGLAFAVTTLIGVLVSDPNVPGFTSPSP